MPINRFGWQAAAALGLVMSLAGCTTKTTHVQAHPPAAIVAKAQPPDLSQLPLPAPGPQPNLVAAMRPGVDLLIDAVERDFQQGERAYQANELPQARQSFDSAINRLMESGLNFSADPRLEPLMNQLVDTMHNDQVEIGQLGTEPAAEPGEQGASPQPETSAEPTSPLQEIAAAANLPSNPEVDQKATAELLHIPHDLPLTVNQAVLTYLNFFQTPRGREIIEHSLARSGRYMPMVKQVLKEEGLPLDLMYLPLSESGYHTHAVSPVGARGLWQFMPETGRLYGLKINRWEDQRMDPMDSTRAAAENLRDLYGIFHDWYLALAAYDAGSITVARAIERTGYADFWQLYTLNAFPDVETKNYVPIMLAMTLVAKDPALYGITISDPEMPENTDAFRPGRSIDLQLVADEIGTNLDALRNLNPELFGIVTPDDPSFVLRIPAGTKNELETALASVPETRWVGWRVHKVEEGETLETIAADFHVRPAVLAQDNDIPSDDPLAPGRLVFVPAPVAPPAIFYRVRSGDTVGGIAERYRVPIDDLRLWNHLRSNLIRPGELLRVFARGEDLARFESVSSRETNDSTEAADSPREARAASVHIVRPGDTLWSISRRYGISLEALRAANPRLGLRGLQAGERLNIPK
jgi:membrane-bound lytic murein transglycosylase D